MEKFLVQTDHIQSIIKQINSQCPFHDLQKDNQLYQGPSSQLLEGTGLELQVPFLPSIASAMYPIPISEDNDNTDGQELDCSDTKVFNNTVMLLCIIILL